MYAQTLVDSLAQEASSAAYRQAVGLCLPHLLLALRHGTSETGLERLLTQQLADWRALDQQLAEFIRKHDYRFRLEGLTGQEHDVWRRALYTLSGERRGHDEHNGRS